jgi:hypothetical protein
MSDKAAMEDYLDKYPHLNSLTIMADKDIESFEVGEYDDYLILPDPEAARDSSNPSAADEWCMLLLKEPYTDILVKFQNIMMEGDGLQYDYYKIYEPKETVVTDHTHFLNTLTSCLTTALGEWQKDGALKTREITE